MLKIVDHTYKAPKQRKSQSLKIHELEERLEEAAADLRAERERADILSDKLSQLEDGDHAEYVLVDREEYEKLTALKDRVDDLVYSQQELEALKWRADMGIAYAAEDYSQAQEEIFDLISEEA